MSVKSAVITQKLSDHYFFGCHLDAQVPEEQGTRRDCSWISKTDTVKFDALVAAFDWNELLVSIEPSNVYKAFVEVFQSYYCAAKKKVNFKRRSYKPGLNSDIMTAIKEKDTLWSRSRRSPNNLKLKAEYRSTRNKANAIIRSAKRCYFQRRFFEARSNPRETWKLINSFTGRGEKASLLDSLQKHFGKDLQSVVNDFNKLFAASSGFARDRNFKPLALSASISISNSAFLPLLTIEEL